MNHISLVGNLGQDPEMKYFESGSNVAKFSLALRGYNKKEEKETTDWVSCEAWGKTAELIGEYCKKGHKLAIEGSLKTQKWEDEEGNKRSRTFVLVSRVEFLTSKKQTEQTKGLPAETEQQESEQQQFVNPDDYFIGEDQIPF